jgi:hypothetical protein
MAVRKFLIGLLAAGESRIALRIAASEADFESYGLALDVAELARSLSRGIDGSASRADREVEDTYYWHLP